MRLLVDMTLSPRWVDLLAKGALVTIDPGRTRVRLLPLGSRP